MSDAAGEFIARNDDGIAYLTDEGIEAISPFVTNTDKDVYGITSKLGALLMAAAMARYSRRGDDLRIILADEFMGSEEDANRLLDRVVNEYGDDSVKQLIFGGAAVEGASNLLTKQIEWGRLAGYLEQSTRYIYYDKKDIDGKYRYVTPENLDDNLSAEYTQSMDTIFDNYSIMVRGIRAHLEEISDTPMEKRDVAWKNALRGQACDAARVVLPVATKSSVGIVNSGQAFENMIINLLSAPTEEARKTGQSLLDEMRQVLGVFLAKTDHPSRGGAMVEYKIRTSDNMRSLVKEVLPNSFERYPVEATLVDFTPEDELQVVAHMLHEYGQLPLDQIKNIVSNMTQGQKLEVFDAYVGERLNRRHKPGRAFEKIHYSWDIVCDYGIFRDLQRHRMVDELTWQDLTPWYGHETPELVKEAGYEDVAADCFELSERLYSKLWNNGHESEAQYATLFGHRMRWKWTYNAREAFHLHELRTTPQGHPGYRKLVNSMHQSVALVHPHTAAAMKFVNQGEDAELTRLAAEQYLQRKRRESGLSELSYDDFE